MYRIKAEIYYNLIFLNKKQVKSLYVKIIQRILRTTENAVQMQIYAGIYTCCLAVIIQHNIQLDKCTRVFT